MKPSQIKNLLESDLEDHVKAALVNNYFEAFCTSDEVIDLIENPRTNILVLSEILKMYSLVPFYGSNRELVNSLSNIYEKRNEYTVNHVRQVISAMGLHDVTLLYDMLVEDPNKFINDVNDTLYCAIVDYFTQLINNNNTRLMYIAEAFSTIAQSSNKTPNTAYLFLMDICYVFSEDILVNLPIEVSRMILSIKDNVTSTSTNFAGVMSDLSNIWPSMHIHFYDYNYYFESVYERFRPSSYLRKEGSVEVENISAFRKAINSKAPVTSLMLSEDDIAQLSVFIGISLAGRFHIIPCLYNGLPKGLLLLEIDDSCTIELPYHLGTIIVGKHLGKISYDRAEQLSAMRYYHDFVRQHGFASKSLAHEVNKGLGRIIDSIKTLRKNFSLSEDDQDALQDLEEARDEIDNAVLCMTDYSNPLVVEKDINSVIETVLRSLRTHLKKEKIRDVFNRDPNNGRITSGPSIYTILGNIIINSVTATKGNSTIRSIIITAESSYDEVTVTISDNGCGVDPAIREKIFNENFTTWGNGIGLAIVKSLLKALGGKVRVGNPNQGAEFIIILPRGRNNV